MRNLFGPITVQDTLLPGELACRKCGLCRTDILSPKIKPYGAAKRKIMVIGEGPGEEEDKAARPWQGRAGRLLQKELRRLGIDLFQDCVSYNAVNCRPTSGRNNRAPTSKEIQMCRNHVLRAVYEYKPHVILLLGGPAVDSVIGARWTKDLKGITRWRGFTIPDREFKAWLCPTFHPSYVMREESRAVTTVFRQDLERALAMIDQPLPAQDNEAERIVIVESTEDLVGLVRDARYVAWDYETTGLKPYDKEHHKIVACALAPSEGVCYVTAYPDLRKLKRVLADRRIGKIVQNMKFEATWTKVMGGYDPRNLEWDTTLAAHIIDNRRAVTKLKFQLYVHFGLVGYDDDVAPYLEGINRKDANSPNRIEELMASPYQRRKVLEYCGIDALGTYRLAMKQMRQLGALQ